MKIIKKFFSIILCLSMPGACTVYSPILFVIKNYSYESLNSNPLNIQKIKKKCKENGFLPEYAIITKQDEDLIEETINESKATVIYLDPLIREFPGNIAGKYRDRIFFTLKRNFGGVAPVNLIAIEYDRREIFRKAGSIAGELIKKEILKKPESVKSENIKAGMIVYPASGEVEREASEYMQGFFINCSEDLFIYREVSGLDDRENIKNIIAGMRSDGVILFFFRMYSLNIFCLDYVKKEGGYTILENWNNSSEYTDVVLFSINDDFPGTISDVFHNIRTGKGGNNEWIKRVVKGKVEIVWGNVISPLQ